MTPAPRLTSSGTRARRTVLISGASIAGPALAFWLNRYGYAVTVVEKAATLRSGGYPVDVRGTALEVVRRMGILPRLEDARSPRTLWTAVQRAGTSRCVAAI